jgi:hypothetical protein
MPSFALTAAAAAAAGYTWVMDGSMPGTIAVLTQYINQQQHPLCSPF